MMWTETSMGIKSARSEQNWATCVNSISSALMVSGTKLGGEGGWGGGGGRHHVSSCHVLA